MTCNLPRPIYFSHATEGIRGAVDGGDGYTVRLEWRQAFPDTLPYRVFYNIYYSTLQEDVFSEGVKAVALGDDGYVASILGLSIGDTVWFGVRATEIDPSWYEPSLLPDGFPGLKVLPEGSLLANMTEYSNTISVSDISEFPSKGIVQVGLELIKYSSKDVMNSQLIIADTLLDRGFLNTNIRSHAIDGYDGHEQQDPFVKFWKGFEETNDVTLQTTLSFRYPNFARTNADGYRTITRDNFNSELSGQEADADGIIQPLPGSNDSQIDFQPYDYSGYHRTDPAALLNGDCIGTYYGGERFCADGYDGVGMQLRGLPLNEESNRRQEVLLNLTGEPVVLMRRMTTGIQCSCIESSGQNPSLRCNFCYGTAFIGGYEPFVNPRRSDGRILIRFGPTDDNIKIEDDGLESVFIPDCWTLVTPALKSRDFIIRFREDGATEEFRYEILNINRNKLLNSISGGQKFKCQRVRKTDPIYQVKTIKSTATIPEVITTGIGLVAGPGGIPPHVHTITIASDQIITVGQINGTTSIAQGHTHEVRNGVVQSGGLGHSHTLVLP